MFTSKKLLAKERIKLMTEQERAIENHCNQMSVLLQDMSRFGVDSGDVGRAISGISSIPEASPLLLYRSISRPASPLKPKPSRLSLSMSDRENVQQNGYTSEAESERVTDSLSKCTI